MTDRELLEAAAKAAGYKLHNELMEQRAASNPEAIALALREPGNTWWNPLTDDGDALRLAVALEIVVTPLGCVVQAFKDGGAVATEDKRTDPAAATRRAITRAAAAMTGEGGKP